MLSLQSHSPMPTLPARSLQILWLRRLELEAGLGEEAADEPGAMIALCLLSDDGHEEVAEKPTRMLALVPGAR